MNKHLYIAGIALASLVAFSACKDSDDPAGDKNDGSVTVELLTDVETRASVTTKYSDGDVMNVYAKTYNSLESDDKLRNVKAEYKNGSWTSSPEIRLKEGENVFLFAVSPYSADYTNGTALPIDISKQIDLLYSGGSVAATFKRPSAKFTMKHAMALASFNIIGDGADHTLNSISITGDGFYTKATFNIETGKFKGTSKDQYVMSRADKITDQGWTTEYPQMWVVPFNTKTSKESLVAVIDGKTYIAEFPEVEMRSGFQYIFRLVFTKFGLEFVPTMTETISLNQQTDEFGDLENYGMLRFTVDASAWTLPTLLGNGVFGKASAAGDVFSYKSDEIYNVDFSSASGNVVEIESWNSDGFIIDNLKGVTTIDLSEY